MVGAKHKVSASSSDESAMVARTSPRASGMAESGSDLDCGESVIGLDSFAVEEDVGMHRRNGPGTAANGFLSGLPEQAARHIEVRNCRSANRISPL